MREVSVRACETLLTSLDDERVSPAEWLAGLPIDLETLKDPREWIDWDLFVALVERFEDLANCIDPMQRAGARILRDPTMVENAPLAYAFMGLEQLYDVGGRLLTAAYFTHVHRGFERQERGRFRIVYEIPKSYRGCEAFFRLQAAMARSAPRVVGLPDAGVEAQITPHRGVYLVDVPKERLTRRLVRRVRRGRRRAGLERSLLMLAEKEEELRARRRASLEEHGSAGGSARAALDALGAPLLVVDVWGEDDLRVFGINRMMELETGLRDRDVAGRRLRDALAEGETEPWIDLVWRCVERRGVVERGLLHRGETRRIRMVPLLGDRGDVTRVYASFLSGPTELARGAAAS